MSVYQVLPTTLGLKGTLLSNCFSCHARTSLMPPNKITKTLHNNNNDILGEKEGNGVNNNDDARLSYKCFLKHPTWR